MKKEESKSEKEPTWDEIGKAIGAKIEKGTKSEKCKSWNMKTVNKGGCGAFYFLGFIGSAVYFISSSVGFWAGVLGFLKAIVWPAFFVYGALKFLGL